MKKTALLFLLTSALAASAFADNALFGWMQGEWEGQGKTHFLISGKTIALRIHTTAHVEGDRLISKNEVFESAISSDGVQNLEHHYLRQYWIRAKADSQAEYELGTGDTVSALGEFKGYEFRVEQNMGGGEPPYVIQSATGFKQDRSLHTESTWHGDRKVSETEIRFKRISP